MTLSGLRALVAEFLSVFIHCHRLQQLEDENSELRSCVPCLKASIERLEEVRGEPSHLERYFRLILWCV